MKDLKERLAEKVDGTNGNTPSPDNVVHINPGGDNPQKQSPFAVTAEEAKEWYTLLQSYIKEAMTEGVDYGVIPNCEKPSLLKLGAEKLCEFFGFSISAEVINRTENFSAGLFSYTVKVSLLKVNGQIVSEGVGCCNSRENAYREGAAFDVANTILKMAKKRAFIDAALSATRSSSIFTQDMEGSNGIGTPTAKQNNDSSIPQQSGQPQGRPFNNQNRRNSQAPSSQNSNLKPPASNIKSASPKQLAYIKDLVEKNQIPHTEVKSSLMSRYNAQESKMLTHKQASDFIDWIKSYNRKPTP